MNRAVVIVCVAVTACAVRSAQPADIRLGEDACGHCRMTIVSEQTAAQIAEPGAEPIMFDDIGCLRNYLDGTPLGARAVAFVADHRTGEWVDARQAVFTKTAVNTPMSSGLLAHVDTQSRDADAAATGGAPIAALVVLGGDGRRARP